MNTGFLQKINRFLLYGLLFILPFQLGKHFFPNYTFISGVPIDYLSPTMYVSDILAFLLICFYVKKIVPFIKHAMFFSFAVLLILNIVFSQSAWVSLFKSFKIMEVLFLFIIFKNSLLSPKKILLSFGAGAIFEFGLALAQFIRKESVQGIFYFFGERSFTLSTPNIAKASINTLQILRPYATFSHPNSMAGFYLLIYVFLLTYQPFKKIWLLRSVVLLICSMLVFISFSKIVILTYLLLNILYVLKHRKQIDCNFCVFSRLFIFIVVASVFLFTQGDADSLQKRMILIDDAITTIISQPIVGVGLGSYLFAEAKFPSNYPYFFLQPVHNIFLLILAECGLLLSGFLGYVFYNWIYKYIQHEAFLYCLLTIGITGMFDHYWLTLQQNLLLVPIVLGIIIHGQTSAKNVHS